MQQPEQKPCPECGGLRVLVDCIGYGQIVLYQKKRSKSHLNVKKTSAT